MENMNRKWKLFFIIFIILVVVVWIGKSKYEHWKIEKEQKIQDVKKAEKLDNLVKELASKYNAIINWHNTSNSNITYSIDLERLLENKNGRPIILLGTVSDIFKR